MNYNIRKEFLGTSQEYRNSSIFNTSLDEPTYLTFKLDFYSDELKTDNTLYDTLPQALFSLGDQYNGSINDWNPLLGSPTSFISSFKGSNLIGDNFINDRKYSALEYLYSRNEDYRCFMLANFIKGWNDLQTKYQFYFQEVEGLEPLFVSRPDKGQKIDKSATITIKCLEAIDQKVKYLLNLYRSAAWDDHYQRWILPEIYRYFKLNIYISEIRTFHQSNYADSIVGNPLLKSLFPDLYKSNGSFRKLLDNVAGRVINNVTGKVLDAADELTQGGVNENAVIDQFTLNSVYGFLPVTCLHCEMCDFDINNNPYQGSYNINNDKMEETTIKIRVRQVEEWHNWRYIDPYKNLLNNTDRKGGQAAYLSGFYGISNDADGFFNNEVNMSESELKHNYGGRIDSGWIVDALGNVIGKVKSGEDTAPLDLAADIYQNVRNAIAQKKATEENFELSEATPDEVPSRMSVGLMDDNNIQASTAAIDINDENYDALMTALRTDNTLDYIRQHANDVNAFNSREQAYADSMMNDIDAKYEDLIRKSEGKSAPSNGNINRVLQDESDRSHATELDNDTTWESSEKEKMTNAQSNEDRSSATNLDNDVLWDPYERSKMQFIEQGNDRSGATNLDNLNDWQDNQRDAMSNINTEDLDRSEATDLDGIGDTTMTDVPQTEIMTLATTPNEESVKNLNNTGIPQGNDRSVATDLDNQSRWNEDQRLDFIKPNSTDDRSAATDLDNEENQERWTNDQRDSMNKVEQGTDRSLATDLDNPSRWSRDSFHSMTDVKQPEDRSDATDLDNEKDFEWTPTKRSKMTDVKQPEDRSEATNLDNDKDWEKIIKQDMTSTSVEIDRSEATDLDGKPDDEGLTSISQGNDKSLATNLDNYPTWDHEQGVAMTSTSVDIDRSEATDLDTILEDANKWNRIQREKMQHVDQSEDRSEATDLDGGPDTHTHPLQNIEQPTDRSEATDLDGQDDVTMINVKQGTDRSLATNLDNADMFYEDDQRKLMTYTNTESDRSHATNLDNESTWENIESYKMSKVNQGEDRSLATNLDNDTDFEEKAFSQMPDINQGDDRSIATDLDDKPIKSIDELQHVKQNDDRSLATELDSKSSFESTEFGKMINTSVSIDRSLATDFDLEPENNMIGINQDTKKNNELQAPDIVNPENKTTNIKLAEIHQGIDRSLATDLDEAPSNFENMSLFERIAAGINNKENIQTIEAAPLVDNYKRPTEEMQGLFTQDGSINPNASVKDLIDVYIVMNEYKKSQLEDVSLIDNSKEKKKTIL